MAFFAGSSLDFSKGGCSFADEFLAFGDWNFSSDDGKKVSRTHTANATAWFAVAKHVHHNFAFNLPFDFATCALLLLVALLLFFFNHFVSCRN